MPEAKRSNKEWESSAMSSATKRDNESFGFHGGPWFP